MGERQRRDTFRMAPVLVRRSGFERVVGAMFVLTPTLASATLPACWSWLQPTAGDVGVALVLYVLTALGITAGFHRLVAHRSFEAVGAVRACLLVLGSMAFQGPVIHWVADHRRHHAFTDRHGDPHSPVIRGGGLRGLWWSHVGWLFSAQRTPVRAFAADLLRDRTLMVIGRAYLWLSLVSLLAPAVLGYALRPGLAGWMSGLMLGGFARVALFQHATWMVNSLSHAVGSRRHATDDASRNNRLVALLTLGEGWHNNHHAAPRCARHGHALQLDPTYLLIAGLEAAGLATQVQRAGPNLQGIEHE